MQKSRNSVPNPFLGREKCLEFRSVEQNWSKTLGISFRTIPQKRKQLGIPFRGKLTRLEKPYNKWQVFFLGYFCTFELCGPEIGHLVAVHLTAKCGSHKFQKYGQKRRLLSYKQIIFLAVPESYFFAEFRSVPFRALEWALPWNSEFRRNEHFFPWNNGIRSEAIPRNFFRTKFRCQPYAGVVNTGGNFAAVFVETGGKFATGVVDAVLLVHLYLRISPRIFETIRNGPNGILCGWAETDSWKKTRSKKSRDSLPLSIFCRDC